MSANYQNRDMSRPCTHCQAGLIPFGGKCSLCDGTGYQKKLWADQVVADIVDGREVSVGVQINQKKYNVPDGMFEAVLHSKSVRFGPHERTVEMQEYTRFELEAAIRWLSENPIVPTNEQAEELYIACHSATTMGIFEVKAICSSWMCQCFLVPEPEVPEEIKDLIMTDFEKKTYGNWDHRIIEAYQRGISRRYKAERTKE